jgi:GTP-binding protein
VKSVYIGGGFNPGDFPENSLPEAALIGRSNVGKSSLINTLLNKKQMARVSNTPGRTQALHFFTVADKYCLVDLPGYGFAKAPQSVRKEWGPLVNSYVMNRPALRLGILLMDARRDPREDEFDLIELFRRRGTHLMLVVTKTDKLAKTRRKGRVQQLAKLMNIPQLNAVGFSALSKDGKGEVWKYIHRVLNENRET